MSPRLRAILGWRQAPAPAPEPPPDLALIVKLDAFPVPLSVSQKSKPGLRQDGFIKPVRYSLGELSTETLLALCDDFRRRVLLTAATQRAELRRASERMAEDRSR